MDFVTDTEFLSEERAARKMNVRTLKATKKKSAEIKADKSDVVKKAGPKDVLQRAAAIRGLKKRKLAQPPPKEVAKKDYDGDGKVETPKAEHRGSRNKAITKAVEKVKPTQPKKEVSKDGIRAKIKSAVDAGVKRHKKAVQPARVFAKGMKAGAKSAVKFAGKAKKALVGEEVVDEGKKPGLWDNIHARRKAGKPKRKPGDKNYPKTLDIEEDKAFHTVLGGLRKKYKGGVLSTQQDFDNLKKQNASQPKRKPEKDTRSDSQKMRDAVYGVSAANPKGFPLRT